MAATQNHFMILFDTATSPNNEFVVACSTYGDIFVWNLSRILNNTSRYKRSTKKYNHQFDDEEDDIDIDVLENDCTESTSDIVDNNVPSFVFRPFSKDVIGAIYRLETMNDLLLVGTFEALYIYRWSDIIDSDSPANISAIHKYTVPQIEYEYGAKSRFVEINSIAFNSVRDSVFLGTGHCSIFELNLNKVSLISRLDEHSDYILDLSIAAHHNLLTSASNDGTLKVWDTSASNRESITTFNQNGYYTNCCAIHSNGRYIVSGFGAAADANEKRKNKICLFELNMRSLITEIVDNANYIPQSVQFSNIWRPNNQSNLSIMAAYNNCNLYLFDKHAIYSNSTIKTSSKSIWSIKTSNNIAFVCGTSNKLDLIANTANTITSLFLHA